MPGTVTIFVDEAGNANFSLGSSKTFVIGYVYVISPARTSCDVKKLRRKLCKRYRLDIPEFKFHNDSKFVKKAFLEHIAKTPVLCGYAAINKNAPNDHFKQNPERLYNYLAVHYPIKRIVHSFKPDVIEYVIDKQSWPKERRENFNEYIYDKAQWVSTVECGSSCPDVKPRHENSKVEPCLQVADYVSSAVFRACERGDSLYYTMIKAKFKEGWMETWGSVGL